MGPQVIIDSVINLTVTGAFHLPEKDKSPFPSLEGLIVTLKELWFMVLLLSIPANIIICSFKL
jgi:hypothetical protein